MAKGTAVSGVDSVRSNATVAFVLASATVTSDVHWEGDGQDRERDEQDRTRDRQQDNEDRQQDDGDKQQDDEDRQRSDEDRERDRQKDVDNWSRDGRATTPTPPIMPFAPSPSPTPPAPQCLQQGVVCGAPGQMTQTCCDGLR